MKDENRIGRVESSSQETLPLEKRYCPLCGRTHELEVKEDIRFYYGNHYSVRSYICHETGEEFVTSELMRRILEGKEI